MIPTLSFQCIFVNMQNVLSIIRGVCTGTPYTKHNSWPNVDTCDGNQPLPGNHNPVKPVATEHLHWQDLPPVKLHRPCYHKTVVADLHHCPGNKWINIDRHPD